MQIIHFNLQKKKKVSNLEKVKSLSNFFFMLVKKVSYHKIRLQHTQELYNAQMCRNILYPIIYIHVSLN